MSVLPCGERGQGAPCDGSVTGGLQMSTADERTSGISLETISFDSHGTRCEAWYLRAGNDEVASHARGIRAFLADGQVQASGGSNSRSATSGL